MQNIITPVSSAISSEMPKDNPLGHIITELEHIEVENISPEEKVLPKDESLLSIVQQRILSKHYWTSEEVSHFIRTRS